MQQTNPSIGINVNQGKSAFADKIVSGQKYYETRESDSLRPYVGKRVGIIRTGQGKAKAIGEVTIGEPIIVSSIEAFAQLRHQHLVPQGCKFDIKHNGIKYLYPMLDPITYKNEKEVAKYGIISRKIIN
jgi:predicted transcriptional regulator